MSDVQPIRYQIAENHLGLLGKPDGMANIIEDLGNRYAGIDPNEVKTKLFVDCDNRHYLDISIEDPRKRQNMEWLLWLFTPTVAGVSLEMNVANEKRKFHDEFAEASHQILTMLGARKKDVVFDDKNLSLKVHFETRLHYDIFLKVAKEGTLRELAEKNLEATKIKDEKQENKNKKQRNKNKKQKKTNEKQRKEAFLKNYTEANAVVTGYLNAYAAWRRESYVARQEPTVPSAPTAPVATSAATPA